MNGDKAITVFSLTTSHGAYLILKLRGVALIGGRCLKDVALIGERCLKGVAFIGGRRLKEGCAYFSQIKINYSYEILKLCNFLFPSNNT